MERVKIPSFITTVHKPFFDLSVPSLIIYTETFTLTFNTKTVIISLLEKLSDFKDFYEVCVCVCVYRY